MKSRQVHDIATMFKDTDGNSPIPDVEGILHGTVVAMQHGTDEVTPMLELIAMFQKTNVVNTVPGMVAIFQDTDEATTVPDALANLQSTKSHWNS